MLTSAEHISDLLAVIAAVCLCQQAQLRSTDLQEDAKAITGDLPLEGEGVFSMVMDAVLQNMDKGIEAPRAPLVALHPPNIPRPSSGSRHWPRDPSLETSPDCSWCLSSQQGSKPPFAGNSTFLAEKAWFELAQPE